MLAQLLALLLSIQIVIEIAIPKRRRPRAIHAQLLIYPQLAVAPLLLLEAIEGRLLLPLILLEGAREPRQQKKLILVGLVRTVLVIASELLVQTRRHLIHVVLSTELLLVLALQGLLILKFFQVLELGALVAVL